MKFRLTFKSPDAVSYVVQDLCDENSDMHKDDIRELVFEAIRDYVSSGEYITVEFDTDGNPPVIVKRK